MMGTSTLVERPELKSTGLCPPRDAADDLGGGPSPNDVAAMECILENVKSRPSGQVVRQIAAVPEIRRGKVLSIRRQIAEGIYNVEARLERAADRILREISGSTCSERIHERKDL
jgi:hypothetical protein